MEKKENQKRIINLLKENEIAMKDLYEEFSKSFLSHRAFWKDISDEEESHAAWVETLYKKTKDGIIDFSEKRFPAEAIEKNIQDMKEAAEKARRKEFTLLQALEKAVHLEHGMLENKFFEVFKNDSMELKIILEALRMGTEEHFREIKTAWKQEKIGSDFEREMA